MGNFLDKPDGTAKPNTGTAAPVARPAPAPNRQIDGTPTNMGTKPTRASLSDRQGSPSGGRSGMEQAMGKLADELHPPRFKGRR